MRSAAAVVLLGLFGCSSSSGPQADASASASAAPPPAPSASDVASAEPAKPAVSAGPSVAIPPGKLTAGTACGDHPRMPSDEPAGVSVDLGAYSIDAYPYPNDPSAPALTGVSRDDAKKLCEARGRRLCTELEWEHACKGPKNTRYETGDRFDAKACSTKLGTQANGGAVGAIATCRSAFDAHAMHGFAFEWTSSAWGRGKEGDLVALRGGYGNQPFAHMRCSAAKASAPDAKSEAVGFRCCGGPENAAKVSIPKDEAPALEKVELEAGLVARMGKALANGGLKGDDDTTYEVAKAWRWRPVPNAELFVATVAVKKKGEPKDKLLPVVIELCEKIAQLSNKAKDLADDVGEPEAKSEPVKGSTPDDVRPLLTFSVREGDSAADLRLEYQFGQVAISKGPSRPAPAASAAPSAAPSASAAPAP